MIDNDDYTQQPPKRPKSKFIHFLKVWDFVWSGPLGICIFIALSYLFVALWGPEVGVIEVAHLQRLFYVSLCMVMCNFITLMGMYMNFRKIFKSYLHDDIWCKLTNEKKIMYITIYYFGYFFFFALFYMFI